MAATAAFAALSVQATELLNENYDTETVGNQPAATDVRPTAPSSLVFTKVVDSLVNTAGSGNGVQIYDYGTASGDTCLMSYDFVANVAEQKSLVRVDFDFSYLGGDTNVASYITGGFGEVNLDTAISANANRWCDMR